MNLSIEEIDRGFEKADTLKHEFLDAADLLANVIMLKGIFKENTHRIIILYDPVDESV